jgi:guanine deaminase
MDAQSLMQVAIEKARAGIAAGQTPFGCAIALDGQVIASAHNSVWATTDITAHAEIMALREACRVLGRVDLTGALVASTCEPCPMCASALHWARVDKVYHGASVADATAAGFNEIKVDVAAFLKNGGSRTQIISGVLSDECAALFQEWKKGGRAKLY